MMKYDIKFATRMKDVILLSFLLSVVMFQIGVWTQKSYPVLFYAQMVINVVLISALAVEAYARLVKRGVHIQPDSGEITINGETLRASDIEHIRITGCRSAAFGIKLKGGKPRMRYTFKFLDSKCEGVREIIKWADINDIEVLKVGPQSPMVEA